jgi:hypothetical protein
VLVDIAAESLLRGSFELLCRHGLDPAAAVTIALMPVSGAAAAGGNP